MSSEPSLRAKLPASSGATPAKTVPARSGSGATSISPRLRSIALTTARATSSGERVPMPGGQLDFGVGEHAGVADEAGEDGGDAHAAVAQIGAQGEQHGGAGDLHDL